MNEDEAIDNVVFRASLMTRANEKAFSRLKIDYPSKVIRKRTSPPELNAESAKRGWNGSPSTLLPKAQKRSHHQASSNGVESDWSIQDRPFRAHTTPEYTGIRMTLTVYIQSSKHPPLGHPVRIQFKFYNNNLMLIKGRALVIFSLSVSYSYN